MFRIEIYHGDEMKRLWRILKPNESVVVKVTDHFPRIEKPVAISTMVTHPYLTSGRHIRFRVCADVTGKAPSPHYIAPMSSGAIRPISWKPGLPPTGFGAAPV